VYDVFISYRWIDPDQTWVREQLAPALRNAGLTVLLDVDDFVPGRDLLLEMTRAEHDSRRLLCVLSPDYFDGNRMVAFESLMARRLDPSGSEPRLILLILRSSEVPEWLRGLIPIDWTNSSYHAREWRKLLNVLGAPNDGPAPGPAGSAALIPELQAPSAPKYYLYISDSKVNMLYAQSRPDREAKNPDSIYKLDAVLAHLARAGLIGTIDEPKEYFAGTMPMRWGPCVFPGLPEKFNSTSSPLVYFGGYTFKTVVGLGGSASHVIGAVGSAKTGLHSCLPGFILQLRQELGESLPAKSNSMDDNQGALMAVFTATMYAKGPWQELEFVAKRLAYGPLPSMWFPEGFPEEKAYYKEKILVGTPLYVAMSA
jgi:hypothetical protein